MAVSARALSRQRFIPSPTTIAASTPLRASSQPGPRAHPRHRSLHASSAKPANPLPIVATGPPPAPPEPAVTDAATRGRRRQQQADALRAAAPAGGATATPATGAAESSSGGDMPVGNMGRVAAVAATRAREALRRRFWKHVSVQQAEDGSHTVHLDTRAVRMPSSKTALHLPASKPHLATAIAHEWDVLTSAQQALKAHHIPLTALAARAVDIAQQDASATHNPPSDAAADDATAHLGAARRDILRQMMRYLDTDTLLCWAPAASNVEDDSRAAAAAVAALANAASPLVPQQQQQQHPQDSAPSESLRERQERIAGPITAHLTTHVWPGIDLVPALAEDSILPVQQPAATRAVVQGWMAGLGAWELAGLERAALATKSLCVAARLVCEWSEDGAGVVRAPDHPRFGVDEAEEACTLELRWQTGRWGEVEDSHDVEREDLRRQLGGVVLLVSGMGRA